MSAQVEFHQVGDETDGLRARKKAKTRLAIEDASLALFEQKGFEATTVEEIAERAEVSPTTFFRYFPAKADVLLIDYGLRLPALFQAIVTRPETEDDLAAVHQAIQQEWVAAIDPDRTARIARIIASSDPLRGMGFERGHRWLATVSDALAQRHGLDIPDSRCVVAARVALAVMADGVEGWIAGACRSNLAHAVDQAFDIMNDLCSHWSKPKRTGRNR